MNSLPVVPLFTEAKVPFIGPFTGAESLRAPFNRYIQNVPLNYIHLAAYLREQGHTPRILDMVFDHVTPEYVDDVIRKDGIRVVGIGCMTCELPQAVEEATRLKAAHPGIQIVFGGAHPSGAPDECLQTGVVDFAIFPHLDHPKLPYNTMADAERWAASMPAPSYAIDDQTAIKVVDGAVEVVPEGHWKHFSR